MDERDYRLSALCIAAAMLFWAPCAIAANVGAAVGGSIMTTVVIPILGIFIYDETHPEAYAARHIVIDEDGTLTLGRFTIQNRVKTVVIPGSVKSIDSSAFEDCENLRTLKFAENSQVSIIDEGAFANCKSLDNIILPNSVKTIGKLAFKNCKNLKTFRFMENAQLQTIGSFAFESCTSLDNLCVPKSVRTIWNSAFANCTNLQNLTFGETYQSLIIYQSAFLRCTKLKKVKLPLLAKYQTDMYDTLSFPENCQVYNSSEELISGRQNYQELNDKSSENNSENLDDD